MDITTYLMIGTAVLLAGVAYVRHDGTLVAGLKSGGQTFVQLLPILISVFIVVGLSEQLLPQQVVARWLGEGAGLRGILLATGLGIVMPPSIFISFPLAATMYKAGASLGAGVAFVTSWSLLTLFRLPLEISIVGLRPTLIRVAVTAIVPPLAGWATMLIFAR